METERRTQPISPRCSARGRDEPIAALQARVNVQFVLLRRTGSRKTDPVRRTADGVAKGVPVLRCWQVDPQPWTGAQHDGPRQGTRREERSVGRCEAPGSRSGTPSLRRPSLRESSLRTRGSPSWHLSTAKLDRSGCHSRSGQRTRGDHADRASARGLGVAVAPHEEGSHDTHVDLSRQQRVERVAVAPKIGNASGLRPTPKLDIHLLALALSAR